ncbi:MraY family glycosyltransferase [Gimesia aquarii]|uniref:WbpL-WbcO-like glycosyltransferase n=1 Tax=Gimesia aquarii TaxID=2527964 RepID=A0A517X0D8_9PLAN|nr:glycosyltransferase family 4 protein [Gimesia aquarii]QDU10954.1 WbpL-WbcO-like glycosyltransferase [Gimesia aquarii]
MTKEDLTLLGILYFLAFIASMGCTKLIIRNASRVGLICEPTERCAHVTPTPKGGGLAFVASFLVFVILLFSWNYITANIALSIGIGSFLISVLGLLDDALNLSVKSRLITQILIISTTLLAFSPLPPIELPGLVLNVPYFSWIFTTLLLVWWLNLFNFMDGIDGLASTESICVLLSAITLIGGRNLLSDEGILIFLLIVSLLGFIAFNWAPAQIFMGDVGSTFLGYILGMIAVSTIINNSLNIWTWLILSGVFSVDATTTLLRRMLNGERWYQAHKSHAYQKVSRWLELLDGTHKGRVVAHRKVSLYVVLINIFWLFPLAGSTLVWTTWGPWILVIAWAPLVFLAFYFGAGTQKELAPNGRSYG